jgi:lipoyl(octanoyl) transferase
MEWRNEIGLVQYESAVTLMEQRVAEIRAGDADELIWLLEHPPMYTAGTSANPSDLLHPQFPVYETGRGGQFTYHGPGQRVAYAMVDLRKRQQVPDIRKYVCDLEEWVILALSEFGVKGERREGRIGIWVVTPEGEKKIAAIGVRVRHWVAYHGISINLKPDLSHFEGIIPCGIREFGVTSLHDLGVKIKMAELDQALERSFSKVFG